MDFIKPEIQLEVKLNGEKLEVIGKF